MRNAKENSILILGGDIFDFLVHGPKSFFKEYEEFFKCCDELRLKNITIHYIEGNHDFHLKLFFKNYPHVHVHHEKVHLQINGRRFYCAHGDLIDKKDYSYRFLRFLLRSYLVKLLAEMMRENLILKIKQVLSQSSRGRIHNHEKSIHTKKCFLNFSIDRFKEGFDFVVLGHSHFDDEEFFKIGEKLFQYMNNGHPKTHHKAISYNEELNKLIRIEFR